jgi:putative transcriptional regulator
MGVEWGQTHFRLSEQLGDRRVFSLDSPLPMNKVLRAFIASGCAPGCNCGIAAVRFRYVPLVPVPAELEGTSVTPRNKPLRKPSSRSNNKSTKLGRELVESAKPIAQHMRGEIELPMKVVRVVPDVDVRAIREGQGLTREQFAERYGLQVRAIQEWEQGRRKPEPAVRAYMLVIKNQPAAVRRALTAA